MIRQISKRGKDFAAIIGLIVVAAVVAVYVLGQERFRFPFSETPMKLRAEFSTAQAVTPGQGQTVRVSGVRIGDISKVDLVDGRAVITMDVDQKYAKRIHTDASALLRPKTGLKDMFVELAPGSKRAPRARDGFTIPVSRTVPDVNPDEIFSALDADTRSYLQLLVNGAGQGLKGRGGDLAEVFRRFEPTHRDLARFAKAVAGRRADLAHLVSSLRRLNGALADKRQDLSKLVDSSAAVFHSFALERENVTRSFRLLPGTLRQTTQTLVKVRRLAGVIGPASNRLIPAARALPAANAALTRLARAETPDVRDRIRPFVVAARPLVRRLKPASARLATSTPHLTTAFRVLNDLFNTLSYNDRGREAPGSASRQEGFLFWVAWLNHQANTLFSTQDANGGYRPLFIELSCATIQQTVKDTPAAEFVANFTPILTSAKLCAGNSKPGGLPGLPALPPLPLGLKGRK